MGPIRPSSVLAQIDARGELHHNDGGIPIQRTVRAAGGARTAVRLLTVGGAKAREAVCFPALLSRSGRNQRTQFTLEGFIFGECDMSIGLIILIILVLVLLGGFGGIGGRPFYGTGYYGGGGLGIVIVILLILVLTGRL